MPDLSQLIGHWGYLAIFLFVVLGNVGLPVPEETILALAGYLVWGGKLRLALVLAVGILSAAAGDNLGYWIGRKYGRDAIERYEHRVLVAPERLDSIWRFVTRHGPLGVFAARFIPGLRSLAGPLAGAAGLRPLPFLVANLLGACVYVPYAVGIGYAVGYGLGQYVERVRHVVGEVEHIVLIAAAILTVALLGRRALRARRGSR
jgi:membrane protein DedA with SNARE-associated domain